MNAYNRDVLASLKWVLVAGLLGVVLVFPAAAQATLAFVRNPLAPVVWVAADNGADAQKYALGLSPQVSPDGTKLAFNPRKGGFTGSALMVGGVNRAIPARRLLSEWREPDVFDWSPDSGTIAAVSGPEVGPKTLVLIDVESGSKRAVAKGYFSGVSFAPQGGQLVYARSASEEYPPRSDVYRLDLLPPGAVAVAPEEPHRVTNDHRSLDPLWGPNGKIVFVKQLGAKQRRYGPKNELYLMNPAGKQVRRLTHTKVGPLLLGLSPTDWSSNGRRLLAQFGGQDTSYAVTVNPRTGAQRPLIAATEQGFAGAALSADGKLVLGATGGFEPGPGHNVATVPYRGGKQKVLAKNAFEPDWSR
jgi:Tol biopolymer transport system component